VRPAVRRGGVVVAGLVEPLTERELEVLRLVAGGAPNRAIAGQLVISLDTVKRHVSHLFAKLGVANRTQAVARARELGLLP
jgi:LuxR family transcriptional regulator, maltose regulon positive regulatory protein